MWRFAPKYGSGYKDAREAREKLEKIEKIEREAAQEVRIAEIGEDPNLEEKVP